MTCMIREGVNPNVHIDLDRVISVYSGKMNTCCCGCAGKHSHSSKAEELGEKMQDYYQVSDRSVKIITNKVKKLLDNPEAELMMNEKGLGVNAWIISIDLPSSGYAGRMYTLYMKARSTQLVSSAAAKAIAA